MSEYREEVEKAWIEAPREILTKPDWIEALELGAKLGLQSAAHQLRTSAELLQTLEESFAARALVVAAENLERSDPADVLRKEKP